MYGACWGPAWVPMATSQPTPNPTDTQTHFCLHLCCKSRNPDVSEYLETLSRASETVFEVSTIQRTLSVRS